MHCLLIHMIYLEMCIRDRYYGVDLDLSLMGDLFCTIYGVKQCCLRFVYNDRNMPELFCYYTSTEAIEDTLRVRQEAEGLFFNILPSENIILLKEMPLDMHRKVDRSKLPDPYALRDSRNVAIHPATLHALSKYLKEQAGMEISDVANDDLMVTFDDLQINSIAFIDMILFIEKELNIRIPDTMLDKALFENINSFLSYLSTLFSSDQSNE